MGDTSALRNKLTKNNMSLQIQQYEMKEDKKDYLKPQAEIIRISKDTHLLASFSGQGEFYPIDFDEIHIDPIGFDDSGADVEA